MPHSAGGTTPLLIFDLDGTLIDSRLDLAHAVNATRAQAGYGPLPHEQIFTFVGNGAPVLIKRAMGPEAADDEVAEVLDAIWGPATLVVVSTDLSQYYDEPTAARIDEATARAIETLDDQAIGEEQACGRVALCALLRVARTRGMHSTRVGLTEARLWEGIEGLDEVTGYGAFVFA